jgi:transcriptional antiterminator RfaH
MEHKLSPGICNPTTPLPNRNPLIINRILSRWDMSEEWYVVKTIPQREDQAQREIRNQAFTTWLPQATFQSKSRKGKIISFQRPLFGNYLFVAFDWQATRWQAIASTRGVRRFLGYHSGKERPDPIRKGIIEALKERVAAGLAMDADIKIKPLSPNQMVAILYGPLQSREARVIEDRGKVVEVLLIAAGVIGTRIKIERKALSVIE